jgi:hypothetical protein
VQSPVPTSARTLAAAAAVLALVLAGVAGGWPVGVAAAVPDARLTVSAVAVAPERPTVGEVVVVAGTVTNSGLSGSPVEVVEVKLRSPGGEVLDRAANPGALSAGGSLTVPLTTSFDEPGARTLVVRAVAEDDDGERVVVDRPVPVVVEDAPVLVELDVDDLAVDSPAEVRVRVANPTTTAVRGVVVTFADAPGTPTVDRRTLPALAAGGVETLVLETVPDAPGPDRVVVEVRYIGAAGLTTRTTHEASVRVAPFVDDLGVAVGPVSAEGDAESAALPADVGGLAGVLAGGTALDAGDAATEREPTRVAVVVTNFGTVRAADLVLAPTADGVALPRVRVADELPPGESATVEVDLAPVRTAATVEFVVSYDAGVREGRVAVPYVHRPAVGDVRVTDVEVRVADGVATVAGNVANVGGGEVTGAVVAVDPAPGVEPVYPGRDFFVGTVGGSDFAPFEVTAAVDADGDGTGAGGTVDVPLRVSYLADGEPSVVETTVPVAVPAGSGGRVAGVGVVGGAVGVGVVLALPVLAYALVRSGRLGRRPARGERERDRRRGVDSEDERGSA